ncbi:MAG: hypothetical protein M4579_004092 [Chaenotheca gracillima]|nr:MAG: hypothetical protein M4579_004092 [Chaenotheca gracillima]
METAAKNFFSSSQFAVVGASSDPAKFGHKTCTPINPSSSAIHVPNFPTSLNLPSNASRKSEVETGIDVSTVPNVSALTSPTQTSLSIITPPKVTSKVLREAKEAGIRAVWLQPGSFDQETLDWAKKEIGKDRVVGGGDGEDEEGTVGGEGWCVLVDGENAMRAASQAGKL